MITVHVTQTIKCPTQEEYDQTKTQIEAKPNLQQRPVYNDLLRTIYFEKTQEVESL